MSINDLSALASGLRQDILKSTTTAGSGHPTSSLSAVELMTVLWFDGYFHTDFQNSHYLGNDRIIFSKGHAAPLLYSLYHRSGILSDEKLMSLRQFDSDIEGHPTPRFKYIDVATGSLGQGLSVGLGMALGIRYQMSQVAKKMTRDPHIWVLLGDSEIAEGQVWEAAAVAGHYKASNLIGILDVNRLGQRGETMLGWDIETYEKRFSSFGWDTVLVENGNNLSMVKEAFERTFSTQRTRPLMIIAKTKKGAGVSYFEDKDNWHGKPVPQKDLEVVLAQLELKDPKVTGSVVEPEKVEFKKLLPSKQNDLPKYEGLVATREAYGDGLISIENDPRVVVLDAETSNSTFSEKFKLNSPDRFFEMYIAEQNMVSVAVGMSKVGLIPYVSSFAAFFTRAFDQIRMAQYSEANLKVVGSHAGCSIGPDGSSQMALEDIAMMRSLLEGVVLYPADAVSTQNLVETMKNHEGISYLRLTREKTPILYDEQESFPIGGSKVLKSSENDRAVIVAAGITVREALKAYTELKNKGVSVAVIDAYSIKPLDARTIGLHAGKTGHLVVVEDHFPSGGLGDSVVQSLFGNTEVKIKKYTHLAANRIPHSGTPEELLSSQKIDAQAIVNAVLDEKN